MPVAGIYDMFETLHLSGGLLSSSEPGYSAHALQMRIAHNAADCADLMRLIGVPWSAAEQHVQDIQP